MTTESIESIVDSEEDDNTSNTPNHTIENAIKERLEKKFSLEELFGENWKENSLSKSFEESLTTEELETYKTARPVPKTNFMTATPQ